MEPRRRFKFIKELAQGGFGKVYLAEMITGDNFSSIVAIKLLHGRWLGNDEIVMRSRDEARLLGRLRHRNIVRVEDLTSINGQCAIVMEYLQGVDLKTITTVLKEEGKVFPRKSLFEAIGAMAAALDAAYTHRPLQGGDALQVIHRDVKPSNAMLTIEGDVKVLDFGTARATFEEREAKTQALAFGSQAYMAPERMLGEPDSPSGDVFSLGITLYECLTLDAFGKIPLRQERYEPAIAQRIDEVDLSQCSPTLREAMLTSMRRMLAYEPEVRPSASEVIEDMEMLADLASDAGLKRFARESVKKIYESWVPEQDPHDPYSGALIFEDFTAATPREVPALPPAPSPTVSEVDGGPSGAGPQGVSGAYRPIAPTAATAVGEHEFEGPPEPPRVASVLPGLANSSDTGAGRTPWPPPSDEGTEAAPATTTSPTLAQGSVQHDSERGGGRILKYIVGLLGLIAIAAAAAWFVLQTPPEATKVPPAPAATTVPGAAPLPKGSVDKDWSPNLAGTGGAILHIPTGAAEVVFTTNGKRQEWDASSYLRLRDLRPGSILAKVTLLSGEGLRKDFAVKADKTCLFTFRDQSWQEGECR